MSTLVPIRTGSPEQVAQASEIRARKLAEWDALVAQICATEGTSPPATVIAARENFAAVDDAPWWITFSDVPIRRFFTFGVRG